jgi:hypothetical protein
MRFPGFGHDTHGIEVRDGLHYVQCLKRVTKQSEGAATAFDLTAAGHPTGS